MEKRRGSAKLINRERNRDEEMKQPNDKPIHIPTTISTTTVSNTHNCMLRHGPRSLLGPRTKEMNNKHSGRRSQPSCRLEMSWPIDAVLRGPLQPANKTRRIPCPEYRQPQKTRPSRSRLCVRWIGERNSPEESFQELQVRVLGHRGCANIVADTASSRLKIDTHLLVCPVNI